LRPPLLWADFLDDKSTLDANSRERVRGASQLTAGRVIMYKNRSVQERGDPRIIPPLRNQPYVTRGLGLTETKHYNKSIGYYTISLRSLYLWWDMSTNFIFKTSHLAVVP
jgi:hypothetical protein